MSEMPSAAMKTKLAAKSETPLRTACCASGGRTSAKSLLAPPGGVGVQISVPPRDAAYWLTCEIDPTDPDRVREPPPYDSDLVDKHTAKRLEKTRRFRKPLFQHDEVLKLWPPMPESGQSPSENVVNFPRGSRGRPSERDLVYQTLAQMRRDGVSLNKPHKTLAEQVASRNGHKLGDRGWDDRTIVQHVSDWLRENADPPKR
jgi:hypothetical protein